MGKPVLEVVPMEIGMHQCNAIACKKKIIAF
jgi:hypothetical protein